MTLKSIRPNIILFNYRAKNVGSAQPTGLKDSPAKQVIMLGLSWAWADPAHTDS